MAGSGVVRAAAWVELLISKGGGANQRFLVDLGAGRGCRVDAGWGERVHVHRRAAVRGLSLPYNGPKLPPNRSGETGLRRLGLAPRDAPGGNATSAAIRNAAFVQCVSEGLADCERPAGLSLECRPALA